ncbi:PQQ-binding-like beta-propeller repeat protein [Halovenus sp. WSH3]|uniref:PQQ-binding-like beta-propeller repeat protein n=1 Tax=Halovenus carboxidivorans TaxID=2692199 RepID=A0A6B0T4S3_9EURY|nr:PQQ-binding-like beta-propeller repeat protein [Halovenus carboxidivorans]MXR50292.1 PQQ-binding-like beta-propeller repeat protein [Halovenus carboxidivorans]
MSPSRRTVLAGSGLGLTGLLGGVFARDGWSPGSSPYDWPMSRYDAAGTAHTTEASGPKAEPTIRWETRGQTFLGVEGEGPLAPIRVGSALYTAGRRLRALAVDDGTVRFESDAEYTTPPVRARAEHYETGTIAAVTQRGIVGENAGGGVELFGTNYATRRWLSNEFVHREEQITGFGNPRRPASRPVPWDGTLYTLVPRGGRVAVVAIDPNDGSVQWQRRPEVPEWGFFAPLSRPVFRNDTLYAASTNGTVIAVAADGSTQRWRESLDLQNTTALTASATGLLVPHESGVTLLGYDGTVRWNRTPERSETPEISTAAVTDEISAVVRGQTLYAFDLETGETLWTAGDCGRAPVIADGVVYATGTDRLAAFDVGNGDLLFEFEYSDQLRGPLSPPVVGDGRLYCNSYNQTLALEGP